MQNFLPKVFVWVLIKSFRYRIATKTQRHPLRYCYSTFWLENVYGFKMIQEYTQTYTKIIYETSIKTHYLLFIDVCIELFWSENWLVFYNKVLVSCRWWDCLDELFAIQLKDDCLFGNSGARWPIVKRRLHDQLVVNFFCAKRSFFFVFKL